MANSAEAVSRVLGENVRFTNVTRCSLVDEAGVFLCLTDRAIHVADLRLQGPTGNGGFHFRSELCSLKSVQVPDDDPTALSLICSSGDMGSVTFWSNGRSDLLRELRIMWKARMMLDQFAVLTFPLDNTKALASRKKGGISSFVRPPDEERKHVFRGYFFFLPSAFSTFPLDAPVQTGKFSASKDPRKWRKREFAEMAVLPSTSVQSQMQSKLPGPQDAAEFIMRHKGELLDSYKILATRPLYKRLNLNGDTAQWTGWIIHLRAGTPASVSKASQFAGLRDIAIMVFFRTYIPPDMGSVQSISLTFYGQQHHYESTDSFTERAQAIADTITPVDVPAVDYALCQARASALQLTDAGFSWFRSRLRITPNCEFYVKQIAKSTLSILYGARIVSVDVDKVFPEVEVRPERDALFYCTLLEKDLSGIDKQDDIGVIERWRVRVWRYIAWAMDGGLLPSLLTLQSILSAIKTLPSSRAERLSLERFLDTMLHMRPTGRPYVWIPIRQQVSNAEIMQSFEFNERVMTLMLESGMIEDELMQNRDAAEFPRFLARLLRRKKSYLGSMMGTVVCKQILAASTRGISGAGSRTAEPMLNILIPALVEQLKSPVDNVKVLVMASLVNYSRNNNAVKSKVMAAGGVRAAIQHLTSKNLDLCRHSCALIEVCSKSEEKRRTIGSLGGIPVLVRLTQRDPNPPFFKSVPLLTQAIAALGYLAAETSLRDAITSSMGFAVETSADMTVERPSIIRHLYTMLSDKELVKDEALRGALFEKILFLVKNLCLKERDNKRAAGELFIPFIVETLKEGTEPENVLSAGLQCLFVLSMARINTILLSRYNVADLLKRYRSGIYNKVITEFARQISLKIDQMAKTYEDEEMG